MLTAWKRGLWRWRRFTERRFDRALARHCARYGDALAPHYALEKTLKRQRRLPTIKYHYRVGRTIRLSVYYTDWGQWQRCAACVVDGIVNNGSIDDTVTQHGIVLHHLSLDDYLQGYDPHHHTLNEVQHELIRDGLALVDALRIAERTIDPHRLFYYRSRAARLITDLETIVGVLRHTAMDQDHEQ